MNPSDSEISASAPLAPPVEHKIEHKRFPWKLVVILLVISGIGVAFLLGGAAAYDWVKEVAEKARNPTTLAILAVVYTIVAAIPGVPAIEIGILIMAVFGEAGIIVVWATTIVAFNITFYFGRRIPRAKLERWLKPKNIPPEQLPAYEAGEVDTFTMVLARNRLGRAILKWTGPPGGWRRYVLIGILINTPGNFVIGGGGGIALFCGTSDDIKWKPYFLTIVLAAIPIPLLFFFGLLTMREVVPV